MSEKNSLFSKPRFSLRKLSIGVASVLVGAMFAAHGQSASANDFDGASLLTVEESNLQNHTSDSYNDVELNKVNNVGKVENLDNLNPSVVFKDNTMISDNGEFYTQNNSLISTYNNHEENVNSLILDSSKNDNEIEKIISKHPVGIIVSSSSFRTNSSSSPIGDDYPLVWKNGAIWKSTDKWNLYVKECVSFVAHRLNSVNGYEMRPAYGNAREWGHRARREGVTVDKNPALGSVAWFDANQHGAYQYGHVAWVSNIIGDNVELEEYNYGLADHAYNRRIIHKSQVSGYIHFKDVTNNVSSRKESDNTTSLTIAPKGTYTFKKALGIKAEPRIDSPDLAHYAVGQSVHYDKVMEEDGHQWISYLSYSGNRRYIAINKLTQTQKVDGKIKLLNQNDLKGTFDILVTNTSAIEDVRSVKIGVWSEKNGKDNIVWYTGKKQSNGEYKVSIDIAQHNNQRGDYNIQLQYVKTNHQKVNVASKKITIQNTSKIETVNSTDQSQSKKVSRSEIKLPSSGTYHFKKRSWIKAEPKSSSPNLAYYDSGNTVHYDKVVKSEGKQWLSYLSFAGNRRYIELS